MSYKSFKQDDQRRCIHIKLEDVDHRLFMMTMVSMGCSMQFAINVFVKTLIAGDKHLIMLLEESKVLYPKSTQGYEAWAGKGRKKPFVLAAQRRRWAEWRRLNGKPPKPGDLELLAEFSPRQPVEI